MRQDPDIKGMLFPEEALLREIVGQPKLTIGIPCENHSIETRLALTPEGVSLVVEEGHTVLVERGAGMAMSYTDLQYSEAGAVIVDTAKEAFASEIVLKIMPPTIEELAMMKNGSTIFSVLQLSYLSAESIQLMMKKKLNAIAYELIKDEQKAFPVVNTIAEIEGSTAIAVASELMSNASGGKGILLGGIAGVSPTEVLILGAGLAGSVAARTALALGAQVKIFDHDVNKLRRIQHYLGQQVFTSVIHPLVLFKALSSADAVIGNLRYINDSEPFMVAEELVKTMKPGAIIIDLSVDQGGCFETSKCMTIGNPVFEKYGVIHYCAPNISARVGRTSSMALSNIFAPMLINMGYTHNIRQTLNSNPGLRNGVYVYSGVLVNHLIASFYGMKAEDIALFLTNF